MISIREQYEEMQDEYFAKGDAVRERYAAELKDLQMYEESEREYYEYMWKVQSAGFGENYMAYEADWKRAFDYAESGAVDDIIEK